MKIKSFILRDLQELSIGCMGVSGPAIPENFDFRKNFDDLTRKLQDFTEKISIR